MAAEKENNIIFDFTWGNTYGLFSEGYHVMIKGEGDLYLTWSVDLKYGEVPLDNAKLDEFMKDLKALRLDTWNGRTYSDSSFENADTWRVEANHIALIMESKGANDYPPEWKQFLEYLHMKWSVPVSSRELPPAERMEIQRRREEKREEHAKTPAKQERREKGGRTEKDDRGGRKDKNDRIEKNEKAERTDKREARKRSGASAVNPSGNEKEKEKREPKGSSAGRKKDQTRPASEGGQVKEKEKRQPRHRGNSDNESGNNENAGNIKSEKPKKFRYYRKRNGASKSQSGETHRE